MKQPANRFEIEKRLEKPLKVLVFDSLDSTNTRAKAMLKGGENDDFLIVAREQTKGSFFEGAVAAGDWGS